MYKSMKPTKYLALLRGINVGGNNIIKMTALQAVVEKGGYTKVSTFIQSGNVIFESEEEVQNIVEKLEQTLSKAFYYQSRVVVVSYDQLKEIMLDIPDEWESRIDLRCYLAFVKEPVTVKEVLAEVKLREGIDSVKVGKGVLYLSTILSGLTKSGFAKLIGTKIYKNITIRNHHTIQKILIKMEEE
jgi:uncharacterized protein (DUF1697 family)